MALETNTRRINARLKGEGWVNRGGKEHDVYTHPAHPGVVISVPRHRELSPGVSRQIAKTAGWR